MMKTKRLALVSCLALAMTSALAVTAFAEGEGAAVAGSAATTQQPNKPEVNVAKSKGHNGAKKHKKGHKPHTL